MQRWIEVGEFLLQEATADLVDGLDIRPCLVAFCGDRPLFVSFLRSFDKGRYAEPVIELLALAAPLDADRIAVALGGRAWSLHDPTPPVIPGAGDLRQRVLSIVTVDGTGTGVDVRGTVHPFTVAGHEVTWGDPVPHDGGKGWIPSALRLTVAQRRALAAPPADIRRQARRCAALGHLVAFAGDVAEQLRIGDRPPVG